MKKIRLIAILLCVLLLHLTASAQSKTDEKIPVKHLREDFTLLRNKLKSAQLGLYLYTSEDSMNRIFDKIFASLNEPMTSIEFYRRIAPLNKALRNLHTIFWASSAYQNGIETGLPRFPLDVHWDEGRMYVLRNHSLQNIVPGSVVKRINNEDIKVIVDRILESTIRDGFNETYPIARASRDFGSYYAQLIGTPDTFMVEVITPDGAEQNVKLPGLTMTEINSSRIKKYNRRYSQYGEDWEAWMKEGYPALRFEMQGDVAILTIRSLSTYVIQGSGQDYREFITGTFNQLQTNKTTNLIIDLRNNHGGHDPVAMELMSHLHDSTFYYYKRRTSRIKPKGKVIKKGDVYEIVGKGDWIGKVTPAQQIFDGKVYVLMNGYSASSTGEFIGHLKNINRAVFIGEEAGGNPVIFTGGQRLSIDLPHTHIKGFIPISLNEMNVTLKNTGHGVLPDYEVKPDITDILQEKDKAMEFALRLIRQ